MNTHTTITPVYGLPCSLPHALQLEEHILQAQQQMQHVAAQLEQLEGCEGGSDALGVSDLRTQLKVR